MTVGHADQDLGRLVDVKLRNVPLALYARARQHGDEVQREFALIHLGEGAREQSVPGRLLRLVEQLDGRFGGFTLATYSDLDDALRRGESTADVVFRVPETAGPAAEALERLLEETDEFCRAGHLLTLAASEEVVAFRRWFLGEFARQTAGEPPQPWPGAEHRLST